MKKANFWQYYFYSGLKINYNGEKYLVEEGDFPGIGKDASGTMKIINKKNENSLVSESNCGMSIVQNEEGITINGQNLEKLLNKK